MGDKLTSFLKTARKFIGKHSPEILTGLGITGLITTTVLAVKSTPEAIKLIEDKKEELEVDKLTPIDTVKTAWKPYVPAAGLGIVSIACIVGASRINYKRNAALATAYTISERTLVKYRDKIVETLGEKKEKEIRDKIAQDDVNKDKVSNNTLVITGKGNTLCKDSISGRYFKSSIDAINKVINKMNRRLTYDHYISLNEYYGELGLDEVKNGSLVGWNLDSRSNRSIV